MSIIEFLQNFLPDCAARRRALNAKHPGLDSGGIDRMMIMYFREALQNFADKYYRQIIRNCDAETIDIYDLEQPEIEEL
ncbi:MAG: hypothetical protein LBK58_00495 [Prevotellaceae bacterium]|jgi:hypothetical protein|nr:hypothetical protein [Prevotellaceae bacterium]